MKVIDPSKCLGFWIILSFMVFLLMIRIPIGIVLAPINVCKMLADGIKKGNIISRGYVLMEGWKLFKSLGPVGKKGSSGQTECQLNEVWKLLASLFRRQQPATTSPDIELVERRGIDTAERRNLDEEMPENEMNEMGITVSRDGA